MPYVFISYSRDDSLAVQRLVERLRRIYFEIRLDPDAATDDTRLSDTVQDTIGDAQAVLLVLSPAAYTSPRLKEEVGYAKAQRKRIIPIQISSTTPQERVSLGIDPLAVIDFAPDEDVAFRVLMRQDMLPPPLARDYRRLDTTFNQIHSSYLRSLVTRCNAANLTYLLDAAPPDTVTVMDIYVALKIDVVLNIRPGNPVDDWWLTNTVPTSHSPEIMRARSLDGFSPQFQPLQILIEKIKAQRSLDPRSRGIYREVLDAETAVALTPYLVITGDPGSGKSTLMKHLLLCMAGDMLPAGEVPQASLDHLPFWVAPAYTPIYIEMRELISVAFPQSSEEITLPKFFDYLQREQLAPYGISTYLTDLRDQMRDGDVMFFLDGLDEVPHAQEAARRQQIKVFVHLLQAQFPRCRIVVTSRPYAYAGDWSLDGFGQVHLSILDPDHLQELAWRLFLVVLDRESAEKDAALFKQQVAKVPDSLRNSPLFFTLMAAIWLNNRAKPPEERLPVNKGAIYRECIDALIRRWTRRSPSQALSPAETIGLTDTQLRDILETLAYRVHHDWHQEDDAVFTGQHIFEVVRALDIRGVDEGALLDALSQRAGVIFEKAPDRFQFAHRSLQEYLAACYLSRQDTYPKLAVEMIRSAPQHWHNVVDLLPEEVQRRHGDLWLLIRELLSTDETTPADHHDEQGWAVYYAYQIMRDILAADQAMQAVYRPTLKLWIEKILRWGVLPVSARAELGNVLGVLGDTRCGVGLRDGIPDIEWRDIPAGPFMMGSDDQLKIRAARLIFLHSRLASFP